MGMISETMIAAYQAGKAEQEAARKLRVTLGDTSLPKWKRDAELKRLRKAYATARKLAKG